jgi:HSP20 family molecular chaperone IbpA
MEYVGRPLLRALATAPQGIPRRPITVPPPAYAVKESTEIYQVDMKIPRGFTPDDIKIKMDPKAIHVEGNHGNKHFEEHFTTGHPLDVEHMQKEIKYGKMHLEAPKTYLTTPSVQDAVQYTPILDHEPISVAPGYDIKESLWAFEVDMDIPYIFEEKDITVTVDSDKRCINVSGTNDSLHFIKSFCTGHAIDLDCAQVEISPGHIHVKAPKERIVVSPVNQAPPSTIAPPYNVDPVTVAPGYSVKENNDMMEIDMDLPEDFASEDVAVDVGPDHKYIHVSGRHGGKHFEKTFEAGHALNEKTLRSKLDHGHLHVDAPKDHA